MFKVERIVANLWTDGFERKGGSQKRNVRLVSHVYGIVSRKDAP